jgi:hypothetical protein
MALAYKATIRQAMLDAITTGAGASAKLRFYNGTRPATNGTATTLLAELTCNATFAPAASGTVDGSPVTLTLNAITSANASATNTATWFRIVKSDGTTFVMDGDVGTSGSDLNMTSVAFVSGQPVNVTSFVITEGNP